MMVESWDKVARENFKEAELLIDKLTFFINESNFNKKMVSFAEFGIKKAYIKYKVEKYQEALSLFEKTFLDIEESNKISEVDKVYLQRWIYSSANICLGFVQLEKKDRSLKFEHIKPVDLPSIPLEKVSKKWKQNFPSRDHPDWDKYGAK